MNLDATIHLLDWMFLLKGAGLTLVLCAVAMTFGTVLGVLAGVARTVRSPWLAVPASVYVTVIRGTPLLMQIFLIYYVLPLFGIDVPKFLTAVLALSLYTGAYLTEIVKAGLQSVDVGQREAARALGLRPWHEFRHVVFPQALRVIIAPAFGFFIALIKDSSLVSVISYVELTRATKLVIARTLQPFTLYLGAAVVYFIMCYGLSRFESGYLRKRFSATPANGAGRGGYL